MAFDRIRPLVVTFAMVSTAFAATACGGSAGESIDREVFIATYVDLRMAALETDSARLADADRDEILSRHGVTGEDLIQFADLHAEELEYMREVWNEVELRLDVSAEEN